MVVAVTAAEHGPGPRIKIQRVGLASGLIGDENIVSRPARRDEITEGVRRYRSLRSVAHAEFVGGVSKLEAGRRRFASGGLDVQQLAAWSGHDRRAIVSDRPDGRRRLRRLRAGYPLGRDAVRLSWHSGEHQLVVIAGPRKITARPAAAGDFARERLDSRGSSRRRSAHRGKRDD